MSLVTNLEDAITAIATAIKSDRTSMGALSSLTTTEKTSLVAAINELKSSVDSLGTAEGGATINDADTSTSSVWSSSKTNTEISTAVSGLVDSAPETLNTLNELSAALGDDADYANTVTTALSGKVPNTREINGKPLSADVTLGVGDISGVAPLASPAFTGTPTAPTATAGTNTTQVATTAFVADAVSGVTVASATSSTAGIVELATDAEAITGADTSRAVTPANLTASIGDTSTDLAAYFATKLA